MPTEPQAVQRREVAIPIGKLTMAGSLSVPARPRGIVVFAHGSGSGRFSIRNRAVADVLVDAGLATLLIDLLTAAEEQEDLQTARLRFDIPLLARRVIAAIDWLSDADLEGFPAGMADLATGCYGASTGAAAALVAAAERRSCVEAVVSRGGRPDLAADALPRVVAPTLLIVGGNDRLVIDLNQRAAKLLAGEARLEIIPGGGHLFEEPGALERVAALTRAWFSRHLGSARSEARRLRRGESP
jgi:putative phosphoribosyl transferase